jgi:ISXO2-like transposase domain
LTCPRAGAQHIRGIAGTDTIEGFFSILKRGITGVFHHVSQRHLDRYLDEFCFRYDRRGISDGERTVQAIKAGEGKRLMLKERIHSIE